MCIPRLIHTIANRIYSLEESADKVCLAFTDLNHPLFSNNDDKLEFMNSKIEASSSYDDSGLDSNMKKPEMSVLGLKLKYIKHDLCKWKWDSLDQEKDLRVLAQLLLDWIEESLNEPILSNPSSVTYLKDKLSESEKTPEFSLLDKPYVHKYQFAILQIFIQKIIHPAIGSSYELYLRIRLAIALLGTKLSHSQHFKGRNLIQLDYSALSETELGLIEVMSIWAKTYFKEIS